MLRENASKKSLWDVLFDFFFIFYFYFNNDRINFTAIRYQSYRDPVNGGSIELAII